MKDFISGFYYAFAGFRLIGKKGIRVFILGPLLINTILFTAIIYLGLNEFSELVNWIESQWQWLSWISWLLWPLFLILVLIIVFFCFAILANLIASPFNGLLSEVVENILKSDSQTEENTTETTPITLRFIVDAILNELRKMFYIACRALPLLFLFLVPVLQLAAPFIWVVFAAWIMAIEYMEYPLGNHGNDFTNVKNWVSSNKKLSLGFGMGVSLYTAIPLVNFLAMPVAISSATKIYLEKVDT